MSSSSEVKIDLVDSQLAPKSLTEIDERINSLLGLQQQSRGTGALPIKSSQFPNERLLIRNALIKIALREIRDLPLDQSEGIEDYSSATARLQVALSALLMKEDQYFDEALTDPQAGAVQMLICGFSTMLKKHSALLAKDILASCEFMTRKARPDETGSAIETSLIFIPWNQLELPSDPSGSNKTRKEILIARENKAKSNLFGILNQRLMEKTVARKPHFYNSLKTLENSYNMGCNTANLADRKRIYYEFLKVVVELIAGARSDSEEKAIIQALGVIGDMFILANRGEELTREIELFSRGVAGFLSVHEPEGDRSRTLTWRPPDAR